MNSTQPDLLTPDPTPIPPLEAARRRLADAERELEECTESPNSPVRHRLENRCFVARTDVERLERAALGKERP